MDGFTACLNPSSYIQGLKEQGYTHKRRGGSNLPCDELRPLHVVLVTGEGLPTCALVTWSNISSQSVAHETCQFDTEEELNAWLQKWSVELGRERNL